MYLMIPTLHRGQYTSVVTQKNWFAWVAFRRQFLLRKMAFILAWSRRRGQLHTCVKSCPRKVMYAYPIHSQRTPTHTHTSQLMYFSVQDRFSYALPTHTIRSCGMCGLRVCAYSGCGASGTSMLVVWVVRRRTILDRKLKKCIRS